MFKVTKTIPTLSEHAKLEFIKVNIHFIHSLLGQEQGTLALLHAFSYPMPLPFHLLTF